jgi:hypothetical protein
LDDAMNHASSLRIVTSLRDVGMEK